MSTTRAYFKMIDRVTSTPSNTLVLVGTALDGPSRMPFKPNSLKRIDEVIGEGPLADAYTLASRTGLTDIILYRLNGNHATGSLQYQGTEVMKFTSIAGSNEYNDILIDVGPDLLTIVNIDGTHRSYTFANYPSTSLMADVINLDANYGLVEVVAHPTDPTFLLQSFDTDNEQTVVFTGGSTEQNLILDRKQDITAQLVILEQRLKEAFFGLDIDDQAVYEPSSLLGLLEYGVICLVDMFHDDTIHEDATHERPALFSDILTKFCQNKGASEGTGCIGVIGVTPMLSVTPATIKDKILTLNAKSPAREATTQILVDLAEASPYSYIQVVTGDTNLSPVLDVAVVPISAAYAYAAAQAQLPYYSSMTNKALQGIGYLNYEFEKKDLEDLSSNGYISIVRSIRKGFVPYRAVTAIGNKERMLASPSVIRITQQVVKKVVDYLDEYIGSTGTASRRKTMEDGVYEVLKQNFVDTGIVRAYTATFEYTLLTSEARVRLTIVPYSDVGAVSTTVSMPFNLGVMG